MSLIIEVSENGTQTIACYAVRRLTNTNVVEPHGTTNTYEIRKSNLVNAWSKPIGKFEHNYDDPVEKIVELTMKKIQEGRKIMPPQGTTNTVINILKEQLVVFESDYNDPDNPYSKPYLDGKINGLRIGIMEVEARQYNKEKNEPKPKIPICPWCLKDYGESKPLTWDQFKEVWVCRSHGSFDKSQLNGGV